LSALFTAIKEIALAVDDPDAAARLYAAALGSEIDPVTEHGADGIGIRQTGVWVGDTRICFIEDMDGSGHVARWREKHGEGLYEICLRTSDLQRAMEEMKKAGMRFVSEEPIIQRDYPWRGETWSEVHIVFVHPASSHGLLIELQEWVK
jgi:methylmalonyl-CoA epimerase